MSSRGSNLNRPKAVTSVDVAAESGVSQATVTRAYSSPHLVSDKTQAKVFEAADRLGYVPNAIARSLKSQRTDIIGAVVPAQGEYWQGFLTATSQQLVAKGKQLLLFSFVSTDEVDEVLAAIRQYRLDGLILASANIEQPQILRTAQTGLPIVAFNQPAASGVVPSVSVDNKAGSQALAEHLVFQGARTVLFVGGMSHTSTDQLRYRGAAQALGGNGVACPYMEAGSYTYDAGFKAAGQIIEMQDRPDAVMVASDEIAFGVIDGLRLGGLDVPNDIMVTGFDGLPQASWAGYDLTTLVQSTPVLVEQTIRLLIESDSGPAERIAESPADLVVSGTLRLGRTTNNFERNDLKTG